MVPYHLITEDIKITFRSIPGLEARIWFEELLIKMVIRKDQTTEPSNRFFFFTEGGLCMDLQLIIGRLDCSKELIWYIFENKYKFSYLQTKFFIKKVVEMHLKNRTEIKLIAVLNPTS